MLSKLGYLSFLLVREDASRPGVNHTSLLIYFLLTLTSRDGYASLNAIWYFSINALKASLGHILEKSVLSNKVLKTLLLFSVKKRFRISGLLALDLTIFNK